MRATRDHSRESHKRRRNWWLLPTPDDTHRPAPAKRSRCLRRRAELDRSEERERDHRRSETTTRQNTAAAASREESERQAAVLDRPFAPGHDRKTTRDCSSTTVKSETGPPGSPFRWRR